MNELLMNGLAPLSRTCWQRGPIAQKQITPVPVNSPSDWPSQGSSWKPPSRRMLRSNSGSTLSVSRHDCIYILLGL